jgi:hypothetical protein
MKAYENMLGTTRLQSTTTRLPCGCIQFLNLSADTLINERGEYISTTSGWEPGCVMGSSDCCVHFSPKVIYA